MSLSQINVHPDIVASCRGMIIDHDYKIRTIGRFEDAHCFVPWYWEMVGDGIQDSQDWDPQLETNVHTFIVNATDLETLGDMAEVADIALGDEIQLHENELGVIICNINRETRHDAPDEDDE